MEPEDVAAIAAGLSAGSKRALLTAAQIGEDPVGYTYREMKCSAASPIILRNRGLLRVPSGGGSINRYTITPLGRAVAAIIGDGHG